MDAETAEALEKSIAHWRENEVVTSKKDAYINSHKCALCHMFLDREDDNMTDGCAGCPVSSHTGKSACCGSPWELVFNTRYYSYYTLDDFQKAAKKEREFLESLREPKDES